MNRPMDLRGVHYTIHMSELECARMLAGLPRFQQEHRGAVRGDEVAVCDHGVFSTAHGY